MAENKKHTIEDVLAQYALTEEGSAHLQEVQSKGSNSKQAPRVPTNNAATGLAAMAEEASNRPTMREAHEIRQAEIQNELRDKGLGFIDIPVESLPTGGIFYPEGTKITIRAASGADIRHWSMTDETDIAAITDALNYIIERCVRITYPNNNASWRDLKEIDRFYVLLAIRDFTFPEGNNDLTINVSEHQQVKVHKDHIQFIDLNDKIMKYFNAEARCFTFPVKDSRIGHINIYMPSVGVNQWLKDYIQKKNDRREQFDKDFITFAPMLIADHRNLNDHTYMQLIQQSMLWGNYEWSLIVKVKNIIESAISPKLIYTDESGGEAETPLNFRGGLKALFTINMDSELDL